MKNIYVTAAVLTLGTMGLVKLDSVGTNKDAEAQAPVTSIIVPVNTAAPATTTSTSTTTTTIYVDPLKIAQGYVNGLTYNYNDPDPAMEAFRIVATTRGWTAEEIESWAYAVNRIMGRESGYCPNLRRGAKIANKAGCVLAKQGPYQDSGFGQLIRIHYAEGEGWLCLQEGICSAEEIVANPWNSMTALVGLVERSGLAGWCYRGKMNRPECGHVGIDVEKRSV